MKISSVLLGLSIASQSVSAHPHPQQHEHAEQSEEAHLDKRQSNFVATTGPFDLPGQGTYPRLEVRQMLYQKPNQWTLLMLGLARYHALPQSDRLSYYQIAGIHGVPRQNWDNVGQCSSCGGTDGYCTHDSVLFPGWHRAYVALFEQQFLQNVGAVVAQYPQNQQAAMRGAWGTMRFPFWDWAAAPPQRGYPNLPQVVSNKYVTVNGPSGSVTIINPLFRHDFQDARGLVYGPFTSWGVTLRYPNSNNFDASSTTQSCINAFDNIRRSMQDQVYQLFATCHDYLHFSNDNAGSSSTACSNSLEGIHNTIHTTAGGPGSAQASAGHMTFLATAAFDPIFWLHHTNVDRLFAMWQTINPNAYGASQAAPHATWSIPAGQNQDGNSPLYPFRNGYGQWWTTNSVRDWRVFKYTYPEYSNSDGSANSIRNYINLLYGPSASRTAGSSKRDASPQDGGLFGLIGNAAGTIVNATTGAVVPLLDNAGPLKANNGSLYQYVANIQTPRYALNGSYTVFIFNRNPASEDPLKWSLDPNLVGPYGILAQPGMQGKNIVTAGSVPLTRALTAELVKGGLADLSEDTVVPYLSKNLKWRVAGPLGQNYDTTTIPGFSVKVFASSAPPPSTADGLPTWSDFIPLKDAISSSALAPISQVTKFGSKLLGLNN